MTRATDVIIAGAGPAGSVTALLLARAGIDVLVLDRALFPRPKACGDCLSVGATALLDRLGLLERVLAAQHAKLAGWRIASPDGSAFAATWGTPLAGTGADVPLAARSLSVERCVLDEILLDAAVAAGARFERQAVTDVQRDARGRVRGVRTRAGLRHAALTIGADGLRSVIAARLGARSAPGRLRKLSLTFHVAVARAGNVGEMHIGDGVCAGVAPVNELGRCNLTVVADGARFGRAVAADARAFALEAIGSLPLLRDRVNGADLTDAPFLASGPFDRPCSRIAFDGAVLVGDAAGYYDPFTGQGVYQAIASAELLARVVPDAIRRRDTSARAFAPYVDARAHLMRGARAVQRGIEAVISHPAAANRAIARVRRAPRFARAVIAVTGDVAPVRSLLAPRALAELLIPVPDPETA